MIAAISNGDRFIEWFFRHFFFLAIPRFWQRTTLNNNIIIELSFPSTLRSDSNWSLCQPKMIHLNGFALSESQIERKKLIHRFQIRSNGNLMNEQRMNVRWAILLSSNWQCDCVAVNAKNFFAQSTRLRFRLRIEFQFSRWIFFFVLFFYLRKIWTFSDAAKPK